MKQMLPHLFTVFAISIFYFMFGFNIALIIMLSLIFGSLLAAFIWNLIIEYKIKNRKIENN